MTSHLIVPSAPPRTMPAPTTTSNARISGTIRSKNPLKGAVEIVKDRLYYATLKGPPPSHNILASLPRKNTKTEKKQIHFFTMDAELVYWNFFLDFGPLNLGQFTRFRQKLNDKLRRFPVVCFYSNTVPAKRANAIFLICAYQLLQFDRTPEQAFCGFDEELTAEYNKHNNNNNNKLVDDDNNEVNYSQPPVSATQGAVTLQPLPPFHDASPCACTFELTVLDCLRGMAKARSFGFYDETQFDLEEYEHFEQVENGDLNWLVKDKILAFAGPSYERHVSPEGYCTLAPADYIPYFKKKNVGLVVRLNKKNYHESDFTKAGIDHLEAFFLDGSCPPAKILRQVLDAFEAVPKNKAFAVHCKAGLGRTGTCIGAYIMKHYRFTAEEIIGWMRICRPGCVIGPQQHYLKQIESRMWQEGDLTRSVPRGLEISTPPLSSLPSPKSNKTKLRSKDAVTGRAGQAEQLLTARANRRKEKAIMSPPNEKSAVVTPDTKPRLIY